MSTYSVQAVGESPTLATVTARDLIFTMDQPTGSGGTNKGPTPTEILLGSILGCLNVVIHMIAKEQGITVNSLKMGATGNLDPAKFLGKETDQRAGFLNIEVTVELEAETDAATKQSIVNESLKRCPVSDNLETSTPITATIK